MTTKRERGLRNSAQIQRSDVLDMMFQDGFGPDEAEAFAHEYAVALTGLASKTAVAAVQRHIRVIGRQ